MFNSEKLLSKLRNELRSRSLLVRQAWVSLNALLREKKTLDDKKVKLYSDILYFLTDIEFRDYSDFNLDEAQKYLQTVEELISRHRELFSDDSHSIVILDISGSKEKVAPYTTRTVLSRIKGTLEKSLAAQNTGVDVAKLKTLFRYLVSKALDDTWYTSEVADKILKTLFLKHLPRNEAVLFNILSPQEPLNNYDQVVVFHNGKEFFVAEAGMGLSLAVREAVNDDYPYSESWFAEKISKDEGLLKLLNQL